VQQVDLREPSRADAEAIAALLNAQARALFGEDELVAQEVREWFALPDVWMQVAERAGALVGYVDVAEEGGRWNIDIRTLDLEAAEVLVGAAEAHAGRGALLRGFAGETDEAVTHAYRAAGFRVVRHSFRMRVELPPEHQAPAWPDGVTVRHMRPGEEERVHATHMDAFADHWDFHHTPYETWRRWFRDKHTFDPELWFLALDGDEIAGLALCAPHFSGEPDFGWVELLGVRPPWRRRGLGEALLRHSFAELRSRGFTRVGLGVDAENTTGAVRLYERVGMAPVRRSDTWEKQA
jgi:mycothiol synthase